MSNFRIIYLNLEHELVISNWTLELSILTALPHQLKKKKDFKLFQSYHVEHKQVIDQGAMAAILRKLLFVYIYIYMYTIGRSY